jgi:putative membrane protein
MEDSKKELQRKEAEKDADPRVDLAVERTELALERTQLAWIRTVLSFIAGGIGLDKGMEAIHKNRVESGNALVENAHAIGILLSLAGTVLMALTTWYYIRRSRKLAKMKGIQPLLFPPGAFASVLIIILAAVVSILLLVS